ncbi:hypothetical protein T484DRAFT_1951419 [Baffinella frigidus]|nr:hypothetical protein T484DRAFT_1951419 [Cryptophyta sp. CCMP2293]
MRVSARGTLGVDICGQVAEFLSRSYLRRHSVPTTLFPRIETIAQRRNLAAHAINDHGASL